MKYDLSVNFCFNDKTLLFVDASDPKSRGQKSDDPINHKIGDLHTSNGELDDSDADQDGNGEVDDSLLEAEERDDLSIGKDDLFEVIKTEIIDKDEDSVIKEKGVVKSAKKDRNLNEFGYYKKKKYFIKENCVVLEKLNFVSQYNEPNTVCDIIQKLNLSPNSKSNEKDAKLVSAVRNQALKSNPSKRKRRTDTNDYHVMGQDQDTIAITPKKSRRNPTPTSDKKESDKLNFSAIKEVKQKKVINGDSKSRRSCRSDIDNVMVMIESHDFDLDAVKLNDSNPEIQLGEISDVFDLQMNSLQSQENQSEASKTEIDDFDESLQDNADDWLVMGSDDENGTSSFNFPLEEKNETIDEDYYGKAEIIDFDEESQINGKLFSFDFFK